MKLDLNTRAQLIGLALIVLGVALAAAGRQDSGLGLAGVLVFVLGLIGLDRIQSLKAFGGEITLDKIKDAAEVKVKEPRPVTQTASANAGGAIARGTAHDPTVRTSTFTADAVIGRIRAASTAGEVLDQVAEYAALRSAPGLRGLSQDRIRHEQTLYGAILHLQSLRHGGAVAPDATTLSEVLKRIESFWARPESLSDDEVAALFLRIQALIEQMKP